MTARRRRTVDRLVALAIAVVVIAVAAMVYLTSDNRATADLTGPAGKAPTPATTAPTTLRELWTAPTDAALGAAVDPAGVVVTSQGHGVVGLDARTGAQRWAYSRSNRPLCAMGAGEALDASVRDGNGVTGVATIFEENGFCSQVMTLDAATGARSKVRTSPLPTGGSLVFGGPYGGWLSPHLIEVWRNDLVRTIQYGDQPNPTNPNTSHLGCTFTDLALAATQFANVEHCSAKGRNARVVINFDDPGAQQKSMDQFKHTPRADIDTRSPAAILVGITSDRVAVLVSSPAPAVVVYDAAGKVASRTPVEIPAAEITAAAAQARPVPAVQTKQQRFSLIGSHLLALSFRTVQGPPPATALTTTSALTSSSSAQTTSALGTAAPTEVSLSSLQVDWVTGSARGIPAVIGKSVLVPVARGLLVAAATSGPTGLAGSGSRVIAVDRAGWAGQVDATAVGRLVVETRGPTVVALG